MKSLVSFFSFLLIVALSMSAEAQMVPRTVLLEEGTNWSCGPCAQANPGLEAWLQIHSDSIIQIAYHPNWPGSDDPMYMNDVGDNQGRVVTYYGISGVPQVEIDGSAIATAPASWEQAYQTRHAKLSPVAITMDRSESNGTVTVNVTVNAVASVSSYSSLKLRVAAVQRYVDTTGPNGEHRYMNPLRAMMPDLNGTALTLKVGTPQTFTFTYDIGDGYRPEKMYEVAFVQSDKTKEVVQAASTLESFSVAAKAGESPVQVVAAGSGSLNVQVNNTTPEDMTFSAVYKSTAGSDWTVALNGPSVAVSKGASGNIGLAVTQGTSAYTAGLVIVSAINSRGDTLTTFYPVKFIAPDTKIAFVDVSGDSTKSVPTLKTMTAMKLRYVPLTDVEATNANTWTAGVFPTMVVQANKWIITGTNKAAVAGYLNSGGHLLLTGGEIAFGLADPLSTATDIDKSFLSDVLRATYVKDSANAPGVYGVTGDPVSNPFATKIVNIHASDIDAPNQPDVIKPANGSVPIFYYGTGTSMCAGVRWDSAGSKLAFLSFGLQNLGTVDRQNITKDILAWFDGASSGVSDPGQKAAELLGASYPNPFSSLTTIPYSLTRDETVRIAVVDARGVEIAVLTDGLASAGDHTITFNAKGLSQGTYFCVIRTAEGSAMRAMTVE